MVTFEGVLDVVIPWLVFIGAIYLLYKPLKEPLSGLGRGIKSLIKRIRGTEEEEVYSGRYPMYPANLEFE